MNIKITPRNEWNIAFFVKKVTVKKPVFIIGLPGIGNVGKIAVDFLIDELKAKKLLEITSHHFPHTVFVKEDNLIELPTVEFFYKKGSGKRPDLVFITGDVQPTEQKACYQFCDLLLDIFQSLKGKEIITLGGIGLQEISGVPKVFATGNNEKVVKKYTKGTKVNPNLYGVVGPVMGVAGLIMGLGMQRNIGATALLAETIAHPYYLGIKGSKEILSALTKKLAIKVKIEKLEKEIKEFDQQLLRSAQQMAQQSGGIVPPKNGSQQHYIG